MRQTSTDTLVIGAGPYGVSLSAHLRASDAEHTVVGRAMEAWARMPQGMCLRSPARASSLSEPAGALTIEAFHSEHGLPLRNPVTLERFLEYGRWFLARTEVEVDERFVQSLAAEDGGFVASFADGERQYARRVVLAVGAEPFRWVSPEFRHLPPSLASHSGDHHDLSIFSGKELVVLGAGQSAVEYAALAREQGANVRLLFRAPHIRWLTRSARLHSMAPLRSLLYAPADVGPAGLSRVVAAPELFRRFPPATREKAIRRCTRPAAAAWLIDRADHVATHANAELHSVSADGARVRIELADAPAIEADHLLMCTGYDVDLSRYGFLAPELLASIKSVDGFPVLARGMTSSVKGLHVVGWPATGTYGPLMRHIAGVDFSSRAVATALLSSNGTTRRRLIRRPSQYHFDAESYLAEATSSIPHYRELQRAVADATQEVNASSVLDLGIGTGETAVAVMEAHPRARLTGIDMSAGMLAVAATRLAQQSHVELLVGKLQDRLPDGEFDLVVSSLAVHHLSRSQKRRLFARIHDKLRPGGCLVMADIVRPAARADAVTPTSRLYDRPEPAADLERWLRESGFAVSRCWSRGDLAVFRAQKTLCTPTPSARTKEKRESLAGRTATSRLARRGASIVRWKTWAGLARANGRAVATAQFRAEC